jgi:tRNA(Ile)-lysidine synthetase-like protein
MELARWQGLLFCLEGGAIRAECAGDRLEKGPPAGFCALLPAPGTFRIGEDAICTVYYSDDGVGLRLDAFDWPLILRTRKPGDRMRNAVGWKALDKVLAELGLAAEARDRVPVLEDRSGIVALLASALGYRDLYRYNADLITQAPPGYLGIHMKGIAEDYAARR